MEQRHSVDEQHEVATTVVSQLRLRGKHRLLGYLIAALTAGDLVAMEYLKGHFLTDMQLIVGIISFDDNLFAVDQLVDGHWRALHANLLHNLLYLGLRQRGAIEAVAVLVVLEEDSRPVL